ncbi:LysR family transcriptional regulator [Clostridium sp. BJN0013]|uniref:LysR family transcriptional regulator n=1 Tax=Clostridium sp. BJN0013 TaxID=3236840 RepID=UPI0034C61B96
MEFYQLKTFLTIAKLGSFVQTADALGYAPSTITSHIQSMEKEMGVRLFERLGHRIILTHQGTALLPYAEQITKLTSEALEIVANPSEPKGKLTIGTSYLLGTYCLPNLFKIFRKAFPKVEMIIKFANYNTIFNDIHRNEIDVGFNVNDRIDDDNLIEENLSKEEMIFLTAPDTPLALKEVVTPHDLAETCVILTEQGCSYRSLVEKTFRDFGVYPQAILEASSSEAIKQLIMIGLGISMLPRFADGRICAVRWTETSPQYFVKMLIHKNKWISPTLQAFLEMTRNFYDLKTNKHR